MRLLLLLLGVVTAMGDAMQDAERGVIVTTSRHFRLPIYCESRENIERFVLYQSTDEGKSWKLISKVTAEASSFTVKVPENGPYWFSVQTVSKTGTLTPEDVSMAPPSLKILVTSKPEEEKAALEKELAELRERMAVVEKRLRQLDASKKQHR